MGLIVTLDIRGASVGINPALVQGIIDAGTTPAGCLVRTATENFVLPGTVAAVAALLGGAGIAAPFTATVTGATGAMANRNLAAMVAGLACTRSGPGVYVIHTTVAMPAYPGYMPSIQLTGGVAGEAAFNTPADTSFNLLTFDDAGAAADRDFQLLIFFPGA